MCMKSLAFCFLNVRMPFFDFKTGTFASQNSHFYELKEALLQNVLNSFANPLSVNPLQ